MADQARLGQAEAPPAKRQRGEDVGGATPPAPTAAAAAAAPPPQPPLPHTQPQAQDAAVPNASTATAGAHFNKGPQAVGCEAGPSYSASNPARPAAHVAPPQPPTAAAAAAPLTTAPPVAPVVPPRARQQVQPPTPPAAPTMRRPPGPAPTTGLALAVPQPPGLERPLGARQPSLPPQAAGGGGGQASTIHPAGPATQTTIPAGHGPTLPAAAAVPATRPSDPTRCVA